MSTQVPVLGFCGYSGSGKTTLLCLLLKQLKQRGLRVGLIKHAHHTFEIDYPGKDSYELRKAGAEQILVASKQRWALIAEEVIEHDPHIDELLPRLKTETLDLVLAEGFKMAAIAKVEIHRPSFKRPLLCPEDTSIIAVATDAELTEAINVPQLNLNDIDEIACFVCDFIGNKT